MAASLRDTPLPPWPPWARLPPLPRHPAASVGVPGSDSGRGGGAPSDPDRRRPGGAGRERPDSGRDRRGPGPRMDGLLHRWSADPGSPGPRSTEGEQRVGTFDLYEEGAGDGTGEAGGGHEPPADRRLWPVLPLGAGLVCLGLGLASLALRLRR